MDGAAWGSAGLLITSPFTATLRGEDRKVTTSATSGRRDEPADADSLRRALRLGSFEGHVPAAACSVKERVPGSLGDGHALDGRR